MKTRRKKASVADDILQRLQGFTEALEKGQPLEERYTCRRVALDLEPGGYPPERVRQTREFLGASQAVFARFLGGSVRTLHAWEQGVSAPGGMACRFLDEIWRAPDYWRWRLREAVRAR